MVRDITLETTEAYSSSQPLNSVLLEQFINKVYYTLKESTLTPVWETP